MTREDALRKVRALERVAAEGSGATEGERANARSLAAKLRTEHGLDSPAAQPPRRVVFSFVLNSGSTGTTNDAGLWAHQTYTT